MPEDSKSKYLVAVVVFFYRDHLLEHEEISLRHLDYYLSSYDRYIIKPPGLNVSRPGYMVKTFPERYFRSRRANGRLLLKNEFYSAFSSYQYVLNHELDSIVFSDKLRYWVEKGYDYIGAPWLGDVIDHQAGYNFPYGGVDAVGNGGFSLRKISTFMKVIETARQPIPKITGEFVRALICPRQKRYHPDFFKNLQVTWSRTASHRTLMNEDNYWGFEAKKIFPDFNLPSLEEALKFSFEGDPHRCFERNNHELPFGSHAWHVCNADFWQPYLLKK
ncbi:MAG: hypothetical protein JW867_00200 [Candidatus Omnitrophica bacterium]|nr:hypothetical protein [Candidatus Omnitrophota bacterium]